MDFKKLTEDIKIALNAKEISEVIEKVKSAESDGTFEVIISTADQDRQGEVVDQKGWDFTHYKNNPIVLWAHDYSLLPIGVADEVWVEGKATKAKGRFASMEANPFAQQVRKLYEAGMIKTVSVGFIAKEMQKNVITKAELLEFSFVPVPANPFALTVAQAKELGIDIAAFKAKGVEFKEEGGEAPKEEEKKEEQETETTTETEENTETETTEEKAVKAEGDVCELPDGTEGVMKPDADGELVCKPKDEVTDDTEEKGAVADEIADRDTRQEKWDKMQQVDAIMYAFYEVYFDENTPAENFETLLAETITLLQAVSGNAVADGTTVTDQVGKAQGQFILKMIEQKAGRVLSEKNRTTINEAINGMEAGVVALKELLKATDVQGGEEEKSQDGTPPKQERSKSEGVELQKMNDWVSVQKLLRAIANVTTQSLEEVNKKIKNK